MNKLGKMEKIVLLLAFYFSHPYKGKQETWDKLCGLECPLSEELVLQIIDHVLSDIDQSFDFAALEPFKDKQLAAQTEAQSG